MSVLKGFEAHTHYTFKRTEYSMTQKVNKGNVIVCGRGFSRIKKTDQRMKRIRNTHYTFKRTESSMTQRVDKGNVLVCGRGVRRKKMGHFISGFKAHRPNYEEANYWSTSLFRRKGEMKKVIRCVCESAKRKRMKKEVIRTF